MKGLLVLIAFILVFFIFLISSCESPQDLNRPGDKMDGFITYVDSNLIRNGGYYSVSVYNADYSDPFNSQPIAIDSLVHYKVGIHYEAQFSFDGIPAGRFYVASTWSRYPKIPNEIPIVLGIYGCDTSFNCATPTVIIYPNTNGNFRNITSWTDTTKRVY